MLHIGEGSTNAILGEFTPVGKQKSAHFVVSNAGGIWQCVSVLDTAYANGLTYKSGNTWIDPERNIVTPAWQGLIPPTNPNFTTISIEREGYYQDRPSAAENAAVVRILCYLHEQFPTLLPAWAFMQTLIGHCHISPKARKNCPGPHVDYVALAAAANAASAPPAPPARAYTVRGLPVYQRSDRKGPLWGYLSAGETVVIDDASNGHLADNRGFVDVMGLEPLP